MNSRRLIGFSQCQASRIKYSRSEPCIAAKVATHVRDGVRSGPLPMSARCPVWRKADMAASSPYSMTSSARASDLSQTEALALI